MAVVSIKPPMEDVLKQAGALPTHNGIAPHGLEGAVW